MGKTKCDPKIRWTDTARGLLVEAVIKIEEEIMLTCSAASKPVSLSNPQLRKWERINKLLPAELQGRSWNHRRRVHSTYYKCEKQFHHILHAFRYSFRDIPDSLRRKTGRSSHHIIPLNKVVIALLKKREDRLTAHNSTPAENRLIAADSRGGKNSNTSSVEAHQQLPPSNNRFLDAGTREERLSRKQPRDTGTKSGAAAISDHDSAHCTLLDHPFEKEEIETGHMVLENSVGPSSNGAHSLGLGFGDSVVWSKTASSNLGHISRSLSDFHPENMGENPHPARESSSPARPRGDHSPATGTERRRRTAFMAESGEDEHLFGSLNASLGTVDFELSHLSSWLQNEFICDLQTDVNQRAISSLSSRKRRQLTVGTGSTPLDVLVLRSLEKTIDLQIRALFQKVRDQFAEKLRNTTAEVALLAQEARSRV